MSMCETYFVVSTAWQERHSKMHDHKEDVYLDDWQDKKR